MNIPQILPSLDVGGVETGTVDMARYLVRKAHKAIVISGGTHKRENRGNRGRVHFILTKKYGSSGFHS